MGPHEGSCRRYMSREHVAAINSRFVHTRRHVVGMCSGVLSQRQKYNMCTHIKMKWKQDPPTCPLRDFDFERKFWYGILIYSLNPDVSSIASSLKIVWYAPRCSCRKIYWRVQTFRSTVSERCFVIYQHHLESNNFPFFSSTPAIFSYSIYFLIG